MSAEASDVNARAQRCGAQLGYLAIFRADTNMLSTLIQADLVDLHRTLGEEERISVGAHARRRHHLWPR